MEKEAKVVTDILNSSDCNNFMKEDIFRFTKSNISSIDARQLGNIRFKQFLHGSSLHETILQFYSFSIASAPLRSEELAIAYGNRSAMMIHLWMFKDCIIEIDRALNITNNNLLKLKLLCRKARCLNALESQEKNVVMHEAEILFNKVKNDPLGKTFEDLLKKTKLSLNEQIENKNLTVYNAKKLARIENLHKQFKVNDFSLIEIQYNEKYGRHLIAKKDINPGEIIFIEKPYLHCLNSNTAHIYCFHCLTPCLINIPCEHCSWAMYCSEECKRQAWTRYHDLECSVLSVLLASSSIGECIKYLAFRLLISGIREAGGIDELRENLEGFDRSTDKLKGFVKDRKVQSDGFKSIYALMSSTTQKYEEIFKTNTMAILRALARNTTYFGKIPAYEKTKAFREDDNVLFLGSLFYKLSKIVQLNSHLIPIGLDFCRCGSDTRVCKKNECCHLGAYIAPITSLLNHSCTPNVKRCFSCNYSIIVYAVQPIKKGSQLFDCYYQEFYECGTSPRRKYMKENGDFNCDCTACTEEWDIVQHKMTSKILLKDKAIESQLADEYLELIKSILNKKVELSEKHIDILSRGIIKACQSLSQPSFMITNLIRALYVVFKNLYGIQITIPDKCNNI